MKTMDEYRNLLIRGKRNECWCGFKGLLSLPIHFYTHDGGYEVVHFIKKQWLFVVCPACQYEWALWKLGVKHPSEVI